MELTRAEIISWWCEKGSDWRLSGWEDSLRSKPPGARLVIAIICMLSPSKAPQSAQRIATLQPAVSDRAPLVHTKCTKAPCPLAGCKQEESRGAKSWGHGELGTDAVMSCPTRGRHCAWRDLGAAWGFGQQCFPLYITRPEHPFPPEGSTRLSHVASGHSRPQPIGSISPAKPHKCWPALRPTLLLSKCGKAERGNAPSLLYPILLLGRTFCTLGLDQIVLFVQAGRHCVPSVTPLPLDELF